jgi:hypothetical protein
MSRRKQVLWSLHNPDQFVIGSSDLRLYEISVRPPSSASSSTSTSSSSGNDGALLANTSQRKKSVINLISVRSRLPLVHLIKNTNKYIYLNI